MVIRPVKHMRYLAVSAAALLALSACGGNNNERLRGQRQRRSPVRAGGRRRLQHRRAAHRRRGRAVQGGAEGVDVAVGTSGTGGGFKKFCAGETDISNASRPIKDEEKKLCDNNGITFSEMQVANDALTVVVNKENDWVDCLTVAQLKKIWEPKSQVKTWNQVDPKFPNEPLPLYGAGSDSGTFDYFTGEINGKEGESRTDYNPTEDDNVTVQGVAGAKGALGLLRLLLLRGERGQAEGREGRRRQGLRRAVGGHRSGRQLHAAVPPAVHLPVGLRPEEDAGRRSSSSSTWRRTRRSSRRPSSCR